MNLNKLHDAVEADFPGMGPWVVSAVTINLTTKPKKKDFNPSGSFEERVEKKIRDMFFECPDVELAIQLWKQVQSWTVGQALGGFGGSRAQTFKELLEESDKL